MYRYTVYTCLQVTSKCSALLREKLCPKCKRVCVRACVRACVLAYKYGPFMAL